LASVVTDQTTAIAAAARQQPKQSACACVISSFG
jgi:hypothetical protein